MKRFAIILGVLTASAVAWAVVPNVVQGLMYVRSTSANPTCVLATGSGDLCAADSIEANGDLDIGDDAIVRGDLSVTGNLAVGGATTNAGIFTGTNSGTFGNETNNVWTMAENTEDLLFTASANMWTLSSTTSAAVTVTPALTVTGLLTGNGGVKTTAPMLLLDSVRFCGNGSNGATAWYLGPVTVADAYGANFTTGGAACDSNDSGTEATADEVAILYRTIKVVGMMCTSEAGGADDANIFQLRDDTADVTGVTCTITNDGAAAKTCSVILAAPVTVAAGSTLAVKNIQTDDDMSAKDAECVAYFTY